MLEGKTMNLFILAGRYLAGSWKFGTRVGKEVMLQVNVLWPTVWR